MPAESSGGRRARTAAFSIAAVFTFALALSSLFQNRPAAAGVAGALSLAFVLLLQLPKLESFEVLTLKVKLREQLSDAEELLDHLRENASVTSKLLYLQLAFMNRLGSIPWSKKRLLLGEVDEHLRKLRVEPEAIREYKKPFLNLIAFDLARVFQQSLNKILWKHAQIISRQIEEMGRKGALPPDDPKFRELVQARTNYEQRRQRYDDITADPRLADLQGLTSGWMAGLDLSSDDINKLHTIQNEVVSLADECWAAGTITPAAEDYLHKYGDGARDDARLNELGGA